MAFKPGTDWPFLVVAFCLWPFLVAAAPAVLASGRPNVVVIIADDLNGYGFYGGYEGTRVPAMDRLKESAVTFEHAYTAAPVCGPSRAAFFSGLYPHSTGAYRSDADPWNKTLAVIESLPELFKRSGYTTIGAGKLFHDRLAPEREKALWDNDVFHGGLGPFPPTKDIIRGSDETPGSGSGRSWGVSEWTGPDEDFPDVVNANSSIEFLQQTHDKPFFLVYGLRRPHNPFTAPKRFFDLYDPAEITLPPGYKEGDLYDVPPGGHRLSAIGGDRWLDSGKAHPENWKRILHGYLAATSFADWNIGRVLDALDNSRYADDTIVIFWSDNGYHLGEKNHFEKATLWEWSARIPVAVRIPGSPNNGRVVQQPVVSIDLFTTLLDYCGLEQPDHEPEGLSLRPLLENPATKWKRPAITTYGENMFSARSDRYRYIRYPDGEEEFYDHRKDPNEFTNMADDPEYKYKKEEFRQWIPVKFAPDLGGRNG
jgi:arylsulfatase A-like enzyme